MGRRKAASCHWGSAAVSLMGNMRNLLGVEHLSYLMADDMDLYVEIIDTMCGLCYDVWKAI